MVIVLGIDEAGRGPVIGPMVVAGVAIDEKDEEHLKNSGVKDSKLLSPARRESIAEEIKKTAKQIETVILSAKQIDELMQIMSLNDIELNAMAKIITATDSDIAYIDLPSNGPAFMREISAKVSHKKTKLIAEHKADSKYIVVGAASIIAKTARDKIIAEIQQKYSKYGDIGSGYPADERTSEFLRNYLKNTGKLPEEARKSWATSKELLKKDKQRTLF